MDYLRKIIKEEIDRAINENGLVNDDTPQSDVFIKNKPLSKDDIIYNNELGRVFATNSLQVDINNLNKYSLSEPGYFADSINKESWSFNYQSVIGTILIVNITRDIRGGKSFWSMNFGIKERGQYKLPTIKEMLENIEGYDNFIESANEGIAKKIDPSKN